MGQRAAMCWGVTALLAVATLSLPASATAAPKRPTGEVIHASAFGVTPPLSTIAPPAQTTAAPVVIAEPGAFVADSGHMPDSAVQDNAGIAAMPVAVSFDGLSGTASPPDPNGAVGPNHYVETVNFSVGVFTKTGVPLLNVPLGSVFSGLPGIHACEGNHGDPVVLHDQLADRWVFMQFTATAAPFYLCLAISQTPDPTGSYFLYAFSTGANFPDYPKLGLWTGGYLASTREFNGRSGPFVGAGTYAFDRGKMLTGDPTAVALKVLLTTAGGAWRPGDGLLPADLDGTVVPPDPALGYFIGTRDNGGGMGAPSDAVNVFHFQWDFATGTATLNLAASPAVTAFDSIFPCSGTPARECVPQKATSQKVDVLSYRQRPLHRAAYRNYGSYESLVTNQSVEATAGRAGVRWYELRALRTTTPTVAQQGTYAPADGIHRWMGSIAHDRSRNMALGYSVSSSTIFPGIRYTGRLSTDPLNTLPQGEAVLHAGTGSQTGSPRWGDYTSMTIDPTDDCTYWYVNEYFAVTGSTWKTRIGSFQFPGCGLSVFIDGPGAITQKAKYTYTASPTGAVDAVYTWSERFCDDASGTACSPWVEITGLATNFQRVLTPDCTGSGEKNFEVKVDVADYDSRTATYTHRTWLCLQ